MTDPIQQEIEAAIIAAVFTFAAFVGAESARKAVTNDSEDPV